MRDRMAQETEGEQASIAAGWFVVLYVHAILDPIAVDGAASPQGWRRPTAGNWPNRLQPS